MQILILLDIRSMLKKNMRLSNYKIYYQLDKVIIKPCKDDSCDKRETDIIIARNKFGVIGTITLLFKSEFAKFYNPINSYEF